MTGRPLLLFLNEVAGGRKLLEALRVGWLEALGSDVGVKRSLPL